MNEFIDINDIPYIIHECTTRKCKPRFRDEKFTNKQFLELYNIGYNDSEIAPILKVSSVAICTRRWRLNLLPQHIYINSHPKKSYQNRLLAQNQNQRKIRKSRNEMRKNKKKLKNLVSQEV